MNTMSRITVLQDLRVQLQDKIAGYEARLSKLKPPPGQEPARYYLRGRFQLSCYVSRLNSIQRELDAIVQELTD